MIAIPPAALAGGIAIGLSLGLTGAGGSILTLPVLVYLAKVPPAEAVGLSLFVVGTAAVVGALQRFVRKEVHMKAVLLFALSGMMGALGGSRLTHLVSPTVLMTIFAGIMLLVAVQMLSGSNAGSDACADCRPVRCLLAGTGVGVLTGFIGVGGGFLLVPALMRFGRLQQNVATGTSLAIIAFNSASGFAAHAGAAPIRWPLALTFAAIASIGVLIGQRVATRLPVIALRRGFATMVIVTGLAVLWQTFARR